MAILIKNDYEDYDDWDIDGSCPTPYCSWYQENGLEYKYFPQHGGEAYVYSIQEGVENATTPDTIVVNRNKVIKVSIWNVPNNTPGSKTIKTLTIGKNISKFSLSTCKDFHELETVYFDASVKSIPMGFFENCSKLKVVTFREDSPITTIDSGCFCNCISLDDFTIPKNVHSLDANAFDGCVNLKHIRIFANQSNIVDSVCKIPTIERIDVIGSRFPYNKNDIERHRILIKEKEEILKKEEENKYKFSSFDRYTEKRNKRRNKTTCIFCALPVLYLLIQYFKDRISHLVVSFDAIFTLIFEFIICGIFYSILTVVLIRTITYIDFISKEKNILIPIVGPLIVCPFIMYALYLTLNILSVLASCQSSISSILDPRLIN